MRSLPLTLIVAAMLLGGCSTGPLATQGALNDKSRVRAAGVAMKGGEYKKAEAILSIYVARTQDGSLELKKLGLFGDTRKEAIDMIVMLLWETGRDKTLAKFADDYLSGDERKTTLCRVEERQGQWQDAYRCWNDLGDADRAERVLRTEASIRILRT
ncbi:hypothetical protein A1D17_04305 [Pseudomonas fluorescens]|jgi:hypothetical protein|uniref:Lipoprotein n=1 Tax=Pseudomonas fluorescens TaxID=294 RepID=A0A161ZFX4_PSEFL|nr:hypothetical protein A1D17_04305 [Pseudomonas fluorescens]